MRFYQPLIENPQFYRLFCTILIVFMLVVLTYLVILLKLVLLWLIVAACGLGALVYLIYLHQLSDTMVLEKAERWIEYSNQRMQHSSYGIEGNAVVMLILIFPFVALTWLLYILIKPFLSK